MRSFRMLKVFLYCSIIYADAVMASEITRGIMLSNSCAACHGTDGRSPGAIFSISDKSAASIVQTLHEFRAGTVHAGLAIVSSLRGEEMPDPSYVNTCYSLLSPDYGISVAAVYRYDKDRGIYKTGGGLSPLQADEKYRKQEARYAKGWYDSITMDSFG